MFSAVLTGFDVTGDQFYVIVDWFNVIGDGFDVIGYVCIDSRVGCYMELQK